MRGDSALSWLISAGIHGALLLGTSLVIFVPGVAAGWVGYTGIDCSIKDRGPDFDRIEHPNDEFNLGPPGPDPPRHWSDDFPVKPLSDSGPGDHGRCCCCDGYPYTAPRVLPLFTTAAYADRDRSLRLNRKSFPTLRHALHLVAHKVDPDCPECLERAATGG